MRRLFPAVGLAAVLLMGLVPLTVSAAPAMTFGGYEGLMLRSNCISGDGPANAPVRIVWKSARGKTKAVANLMTNASGRWNHCSSTSRLWVGDTIRARSGQFVRTFTMPNITLTGNRVTGAFSGVGLPGRTGELWYHAGLFADFFANETVTANENGRWSSPDGASGGIDAEIYWTTAKGDNLFARTVVPMVAVTIGRAASAGAGRPFQDVVVNLRDGATNALLGRARATADDWGQFASPFVNGDGDPVSASVGDRVVSSISSDLDWHIPQIDGRATVSNDMVDGRCYSTEIEPTFVIVRVYRHARERGMAHGGIDATGSFSIDFGQSPGFFYQPVNIRHGDRVVVSCYYERGDIVRLPFIVP